MALSLEAKASIIAAYRDTSTSTATAAASDDDDCSGKNSAQLTSTTMSSGFPGYDDEDDELFELDIALLDGRDDGHHRHHQGRSSSSSSSDDDDGGHQHALLANCLLPARSVSRAVPVDASSALSSWSSYPYSGYYSSRRLVCTAAGRRFGFLGGRPAAISSARFCFSRRSSGFDTMGNYSYFQRY